MTPETTTAAPKNETADRKPIAPDIVPKKVRILGVPLDLGQSRRGVDMGPSAVRVAGLDARLAAIGHVVEDGGHRTVAIAAQKPEGAGRRSFGGGGHDGGSGGILSAAEPKSRADLD